MEFYRQASAIIENGTTVLQEYSTESYNEPTGSQLVIREWNGRKLALLHRFAKSWEHSMDFLNGAKVIAEYGSADCDFSAKAWLYE